MITDINSEDRLVQKTFAEHLEKVLGWNRLHLWDLPKERNAGLPEQFFASAIAGLASWDIKPKSILFCANGLINHPEEI